MIESMNQYYSANLWQNVKRGFRENTLKGNWDGTYISFLPFYIIFTVILNDFLQRKRAKHRSLAQLLYLIFGFTEFQDALTFFSVCPLFSLAVASISFILFSWLTLVADGS